MFRDIIYRNYIFAEKLYLSVRDKNDCRISEYKVLSENSRARLAPFNHVNLISMMDLQFLVDGSNIRRFINKIRMSKDEWILMKVEYSIIIIIIGQYKTCVFLSSATLLLTSTKENTHTTGESIQVVTRSAFSLWYKYVYM